MKGPGDGYATLLLLPLVGFVGFLAWDEYGDRVEKARAEGRTYSLVDDLLGRDAAPAIPVAAEPEPIRPAEPEPTPTAVAEAKPRDEGPVFTESSEDDSAYVFVGPALTDRATREKLLADTAARVGDGRWEVHASRLERGLVPALMGTTRSQGAKRYDRLWQSEYFTLGAMQAAFIRRAGPDNLRALVRNNEPAADFLRELTARPEALEAWLATVKPEDNVVAGLRTWASLWEDDRPDIRWRYLNLQVAMAVVYDRPMHWRRLVREAHPIDPLGRYRWYREHDLANRLETRLTKLSPEELVWVVAADVSEEEMDWALRELRRLKQQGWGSTYGMIRYRMDFVTGGKPQGPDYTDGSLADILKCGGICMHQGHFATSTARAAGIPAAYVTGEGNRGGHAWFAFLSDRGEWNMDTGRYDDGYSCGMTGDPQTGKAVPEFMVELLGDRQRRTGAATSARRLLLISGFYGQRAEDELRRETLAQAVETADRFLPAWEAYAQALEEPGAKTTLATWRTVVRGIRSAFDKWPDLRLLADELEARHIAPTWSDNEAITALRGQYHRLVKEHPDRMDLILKAIHRQAGHWSSKGPQHADRVRNLYRDVMREHADHLPTFKAALEGYYQSVKGDKERETFFLNDLERTFRRKLDGDGDIFRMKTVAGLLGAMKTYYEKVGQAERFRRLEREQEEIARKLEKLRKQ
jgi:hypothetical protein